MSKRKRSSEFNDSKSEQEPIPKKQYPVNEYDTNYLEELKYHPDWPQDRNKINLAVDDLPHSSSYTEWWYVNTHLTATSPSGTTKHFKVYSAFFRTDISNDEWGYALNWAISDIDAQKYIPHSVLDKSSVSIIKSQLKNNNRSLDPVITHSLLEILDRGNIPLPDRMFESDPICATDRLYLKFDDCSFTKRNSENSVEYLLNLKDYDHLPRQNDIKFSSTHKIPPTSGCSLSFSTIDIEEGGKPPILQGYEGLTRVGRSADTMFYYFLPKLRVQGRITFEGVDYDVIGNGWFDHEFGGRRGEKQETTEVIGWNWLSAQLDDNQELTYTAVYNTKDSKNPVLIDTYLILIDKHGKRTFFTDPELVMENEWISSHTFMSYPVKFTLKSQSAALNLSVQADINDQEVITIITSPAFYEGSVSVRGSLRGHSISGLGFYERHGLSDPLSLGTFFKNVSKKTVEKIDLLIPHSPSSEQIKLLMGDYTAEPVSLKIYQDKVIDPIRTIIDRGGKAWRSYSVLVSIECVGGDSRQHDDWLALPELMHTGSLIIDDIQDNSETRRGGPSVHKLFGNPLAINAGNAAYFIGQVLTTRPCWKTVSKDLQLKFYDIFFSSIRAAHAGQALDITGLSHLMPKAVESGDSKELIDAIITIHRLKSAAPAGGLARMGASLGLGSDEQIELIGDFFESLGIAFQIVDDVLNLTGIVDIRNNQKIYLKDPGEDIREGKVTFPVCQAMGLLNLSERKRVWKVLQSTPVSKDMIQEVLDIFNRYEILQLSMDAATSLVEQSWSALSPYIMDSFYKVMLRAFSLFVLRRHY